MENSLILYTTDDGTSQLVLRELGGQVWLTQLEIAELYQTSKQNISKHVKSVLADAELLESAVVNAKLTTALTVESHSNYNNACNNSKRIKNEYT